MKAFLDRKNIHPSFKLYFIDAMGQMALALFATLLMGTIFSTLYTYTSFEFFKTVSSYAQGATGAVLGIAVANALKAPPLVLCSVGAASLAGYQISAVFLIDGVEKSVSAGPAGAFLCAIVAAEFGKAVFKETKVDIIVTPTVAICSGVAFGLLVCPAIAWVMYWLGDFVNTATVMQPVLMGAIVAVVVGVVLTLPISSAALCAMIGISGIAGGAAAAGCCAQMVGFAVISFRENGFGGLISQGLGTSMLQIGNIARKPIVWLAPTLAAAILGPISTCILGMTNNAAGAGMGTSGLVGPIGCWATMSPTTDHTLLLAEIVGMYFVAPAILSLIIHLAMKRAGWVKEGDLKLQR